MNYTHCQYYEKYELIILNSHAPYVSECRQQHSDASQFALKSATATAAAATVTLSVCSDVIANYCVASSA